MSDELSFELPAGAAAAAARIAARVAAGMDWSAAAAAEEGFGLVPAELEATGLRTVADLQAMEEDRRR